MNIINHQRGRPPIPKDEVRSKNIQIRVTEDIYVSLKDLAENDGVSISNYVRALIEEAVERAKDRERYGEYDEY